MDIIAYFGGSTGIKYVHLPSISPLGNREKTLKKNPKLRDIGPSILLVSYLVSIARNCEGVDKNNLINSVPYFD